MSVWKWICAWALSAAIACVAAADPSMSRDPTQVRRLGIPVALPSIDKIETQIGPLKPAPYLFDWQGLDAAWEDAAVQNWSASEQKLNRLENQYPNWTPPRELTDLIENGLREAALAAAIEDARWEDVLALTAETDVFCPNAPEFWAVTEAHVVLGQDDEALKVLNTAVTGCPSIAKKQVITDRAADLLPLDLQCAYRSQLAQSDWPLDLAYLDTAIQTGARNQAIASEDWGQLAQLARAHGARPATLQAAWALLPDSPAAAQAEFEFALVSKIDSEAEYGAALAAYQRGDHRLALALPRAPPDAAYRAERADLSAFASLREAERLIDDADYDRAEQLIERARALSSKTTVNAETLDGSLNLAKADAAYRAENYQAAIAYAENARHIDATRAAANDRIAWSLYQIGDDEAAYDAFSALYQSTASTEAADGLVLSAKRVGWLDRLQPMAAARPGPLLNRLKSETAQRALQRKDYLIVQQTAPVPLAELVGVDRPYIRQSVSVRANNGASGEGRVNSHVSRTSIGFTSSRSHVEVGVAAVSVDAGTGTETNRSADETGVSPFVRIEREGAIAIAAQIASTPSGGPASRTLTGELGVTLHGETAAAKVTAFKRPVDESLTSLMGREDTATGETWGRAVQTGIELDAVQTIAEDLNVRVEAEIKTLSGHNLADNQAAKIGVSAVKTFTPQSHDYLSAGPFYQYQTSDKNSNFHSPEHGGYFSPQSYHRAGIGVYGQTRDAKDWVLRYEASGAIESSKTDAAPVRPLTNPSGNVFDGGTETNLAGTAKIEYGRKLNAQWTLTAGASAIASTAFNEVQLGISLKYVPGGKASVTTRDFSADLFSRDLL